MHFLMDHHHIVKSEGVLTESLFPSAMALRAVPAAALAELHSLFPDLTEQALRQTARRALRRHECQSLAVSRA